MAVNGQLVAQSPADELLERLDDPRVAASLTNILDHADLLAVLVSGINGFLERGDIIATAMADGVQELRGAGAGIGGGGGLNSLLGLATDPRFAATLQLLGESLIEGKEEAAKSPSSGPQGVFGLLRALKDDDVSRGLGLLIQTAKALGRKLS